MPKSKVKRYVLGGPIYRIFAGKLYCFTYPELGVIRDKNSG